MILIGVERLWEFGLDIFRISPKYPEKRSKSFIDRFFREKSPWETPLTSQKKLMAPFWFLRELQPHSKSLIFHWNSEHEKYKQNQAILKCPKCMMCLQNILGSFHCIQNCFLTYFRSMFEYFSIIFIPHNIIKHSMEVQNRSAYSVKLEKMNIYI